MSERDGPADCPREEAPGFIEWVDWEESFRCGTWDYLAEIGETPRYAAVAGYVHKLLRRGRILDVGCGEGVLLDYLDLSRIEYSGFDVSPTAVERARRRRADAKLFVGSMDEFEPPAAEQYDVIVFNEALSTVRWPIATLRRFHPFLRPSGHMVISQFQNPNAQSNGARFTRMFKAEIEAGRMHPIMTSEVLNCDNGLRWTIYCLGALGIEASQLQAT